jgi:hypothetical protein
MPLKKQNTLLGGLEGLKKDKTVSKLCPAPVASTLKILQNKIHLKFIAEMLSTRPEEKGRYNYSFNIQIVHYYFSSK